MFVFKAAVVGAGTMGGEIAQVIASAGIPVVLKDVKQEFVDLGLKKAEEVTRAPARQPRPQGEDHARSRPTSRPRRSSAASTGRRTYDGFGDVDFVIEAVPERMEIKQAVLAELDALHAGPRDPRVEHVGAVDLARWRSRRAAPTRSSAFTSSIPRR